MDREWKAEATVNVKEFSTKTSEDKTKIFVTGIITLADKVIIVDQQNSQLKLFDRQGTYLTSTVLKSITNGVTHAKNGKIATCGLGKRVFLWDVCDDKITGAEEAYDVDEDADGLHYNGTYYCVLHFCDHKVTVLDKEGSLVRKIIMKEVHGVEVEFGCDIHMDGDSHIIYVPCMPDNSGVLSISLKGEVMWFTPLPGTDLQGITEVHGELCVADCINTCLHLISKAGQYKGKLVEKKDLNEKPHCIFYDENEQKLYVSYFLEARKRHLISMYSV